jgi:hypothetical protein
VAQRLHVSGRTVQIALGVIWILDGLLQLQPKMFTEHFVSVVLRPNAVGQPGWLGALVTHMANFVSHEVAMWNTLFALTQLAIGVGLLFRRTVRPALVASFAWALCVWVFGEGMGQLFLGTSSPLMGAPGAVLLYALIGVLVWPARDAASDESRTGVASSAAGRGVLGVRGALVAWVALWAFFACLFLVPDNRTPNGLHDMLAGMTAGEPGWYAHILNGLANALAGAGTGTAVVLAACCLVVAVGPLVSRDPTPYLIGGAGLALLFWVSGEALGGLLTGSATDPNSGPLLILLAAALLPTVAAPAGAPSPALRLFARSPRWAVASMAGLLVAPIAVASIPLASSVAPAAAAAASGRHSTTADAAGSGAMAGMAGMSRTSAGSHARGGGETNMAGMAGTGATDPSWHYTGPPIPQGEAAVLSASSAVQDQGHAMQTPNCSAAPTANQMLGATQYVQTVSAAVAKYQLLSAAKAAGYVPVTPLGYPVVHYVNPAFMQQRYVMDPNHVDSLVYAFTPRGPVLAAAMFLLPSRHENGPMPYGCLVQWHAHTNLCTSDVTHTVVGFTPCGPDEHNSRTAYMTHVWQVEVPGGPLAIDPSDLQVMESAVQAQQDGLAPITSSSGQVSYESATAPVGSF